MQIAHGATSPTAARGTSQPALGTREPAERWRGESPLGSPAPPGGPLALASDHCAAVAALGSSLRTSPVLAEHLREVATLAAADWWGDRYSLLVHSRLGIRAGLSPDEVKLILEGRPPRFADQRSAVAWNVAKQLLVGGTMTDSLRHEAVTHFSDSELMEIAAVVGFHTLTALTLNVSAAVFKEAVAARLGQAGVA